MNKAENSNNFYSTYDDILQNETTKRILSKEDVVTSKENLVKSIRDYNNAVDDFYKKATSEEIEKYSRIATDFQVAEGKNEALRSNIYYDYMYREDREYDHDLMVIDSILKGKKSPHVIYETVLNNRDNYNQAIDGTVDEVLGKIGNKKVPTLYGNSSIKTLIGKLNSPFEDPDVYSEMHMIPDIKPVSYAHRNEFEQFVKNYKGK